MKFIIQSKSSKDEDNKKDKEKGTWYECRKSGHYRPECPSLDNKKGKCQRNNPKSSRMAYVAWDSDSDASSNESSSDSDEEENYYFMANQLQSKKKVVIHSKYSNVDKLPSSELKNVFENL